MAIAHILQFQLLPSQRTAWLAAANQIKVIAERHGATLSPVVTASERRRRASLGSQTCLAFATFTEAMRNDRDMQKVMDARRANPKQRSGDGDHRDITDEIDSLTTPEPGALVVNLVQPQIAPGGASLGAVHKELRAMANKHGSTLPLVVRACRGWCTGTVTGGWGYASLEAWAKERQKGADSGFVTQ